MAARQREWARRAREKLVLELGGKCVICGDPENLEFDHKEKRDWNIRDTEWSHRISIYRREVKEGKIQLLCRECNASKGQPEEAEHD